MKTWMIAMMLLCVFIGGVGSGYIIGGTHIIKEGFKAFEYVDNIYFTVDLNESDMVEAMMPYIEAERGDE